MPTSHPRGRLARGISLLGALSAFAVMAAGCSGGSGSPSSSADPTQQSLVNTAGTAKGTVSSVTWNLTSGEPDTLDPPNAAYYGSGQVVMNLCDTLVRYDAAYNMSPGLASYKQVTPTKLVYTLRGGAKFWDGKPVTTADVVYSLERAKANSIVSAFFANVKSIQATGTNEVTVLFSTPDEKFNTEMTNISGAIYEKAFAENKGKSFGTASGGLMCSGPFKLDSWKPGDSIAVSRNDAYWDTSRMPKIARVKYTFITDTTSLTQALTSGAIDGAYQIPPAAIPALQKSSKGKVYFGPSTEGTTVFAANPGGITADTSFMGAMQQIVDRPALVKAIYHGSAQPNYTAVTPRTWPTDQTDKYEAAYKAIEATRSYDLAAAKKAVASSGYKGQTLTLAYQSGDATVTQVAQLLQQQAKQAGVKIKLDGLGSLAYQQAGYDATKRQGIDLLMASNFNAVADPLEPALFAYLPQSPYNYTNYDDKTTAQLLEKAQATFDGATRADLIIQAQKRWEATNGAIPLVSSDTVTFLNNRLAGAITSFAYWSMPSQAFIGSSS